MGGNDLARRKVGQEVEWDLRRLLRKVREKFPGARAVVSGVLVRIGVSYRKAVAASEVYERVCRDSGATFIDSRKWVGWESVRRDQVHLTEQGKRILGDLLGREVAGCMEEVERNGEDSIDEAARVEIGGKKRRMVKQSTSVKIMVVNCRSVYNKLEGFWEEVEGYGADIVVAVETWSTEEVLDIECRQDKFTIFRRDRDGRGGGIMAIKMIKERVDRLKDRQRVVVAGDLNMSGVKWAEGAEGMGSMMQRMAAQLVNRGLVQVVETPTRWNEEGIGSVLDVVLVRPRNAVVGAIVLDGISDHHIQGCGNWDWQDEGRAYGRKVGVAVWERRQEGAEIFLRNRFKKWSMEEDVDGLWREFRGLMEVMLEKFVPMKRLWTGEVPPYYVQEILKMKRKCRKLHAKWRNEGMIRSKEMMKQMGRELERKIKPAKNVFLGNMVEEGKGKKWGKLFRCCKDSTCRRLRQRRIGIRGRRNRVWQVFSKFWMREWEIEKVIRGLKSSNAGGPDGIGNTALKFGDRELVKYLEMLFKKSLGEGKLPQDWKDAMVVPIHKQGEDRGRPGIYRPLAGLLEDLGQVVDEEKQVDACFIDFEKAFDKVPHGTLMRKVEALILDRRVVELIEDFLRGRRQRVKVGEAISEEDDVTSGVPQGSVLGPSLFTIMVNGMGLGIKGKIRLLAENCVLYAEVGGDGNLQVDIDKIWKKVISKVMYRWEGHEIEEAAEYKYLGIVLQGDLWWKKTGREGGCKGKKGSGYAGEGAEWSQLRSEGEGSWHNGMANVRICCSSMGSVCGGGGARAGEGQQDGSLKDRRKVEQLVRMYRLVNEEGIWGRPHCKLSKGVFRGRGNNSEKLQRECRTKQSRQSMLVREWNVFSEELVFVRGVGTFRKGVEKELRKMNRFNVENRAQKVITRTKPKPAPKHKSTLKEFEKMKQELSNLPEAVFERDSVLHNKLKEVYVLSADPNTQETGSSRLLPQERRAVEVAEFGFAEPSVIPRGRCSLQQALKFICDHQEDPVRFKPEVIAHEYKLQPATVVPRYPKFAASKNESLTGVNKVCSFNLRQLAVYCQVSISNSREMKALGRQQCKACFQPQEIYNNLCLFPQQLIMESRIVEQLPT
ncbi:hypothetical protein PR048_007349 [Dryococelus australis]|uniref:Reverse transcriptase domain-containing protein n=1 Tax=Dryococelus australis TaxID=614101 RepID=A0ABQ9IEL7_9NEOP|nr:hypothetical protein PR048_007349 [Dryococelus australis]